MKASINTQPEEMVKLMERGQITLPSSIRKALGLEPKAWLVVRLNPKKEIVLKQVQNSKRESIQKVLKDMANDKTIYWTDEDEKRRQQVRKASTKRVRDLWK